MEDRCTGARNVWRVNPGAHSSRLPEAITWALGFSAQGVNRDNSFADGADGHAPRQALRLQWRQRVMDGFFLRAKTFVNFATYLEVHDR